MNPIRMAGIVAWAAVLGVTGCVRPPAERIRLEALRLDEAIATINANSVRIKETLRASGAVDGYFSASSGRRMSYHLDSILIYRQPNFVRFDLKKLGDRQLLFGSNLESFWIYTKEDDRYFCGDPDDPRELPDGFPRPDQIADALGLRMILEDPSPESAEFVSQRIELDHQEILFLERGFDGRAIVRKEYWLDRALPRAVGRVIFRDPNGAVEMEAFLRHYARIGESNALLPYEVVAEWPRMGARMRFQINQWTELPQIGPDGPQFATPQECAGRK